MKFYEMTGVIYDDDFRRADGHVALKDCNPVQVLRKINKIIEKAKSQGFGHIGLTESYAWGLGDVYFYFGKDGEVTKRLKKVNSKINSKKEIY